MEILVCVKRVPDTSENEIELNSAGNDIDRDDLVYSVNEWDNYAVEEAIQIRDKVGGTVTVVTKKERAESNTNYAQGGVAAVLSPEDRPELHLRDTLDAGAGLCHPDMDFLRLCEELGIPQHVENPDIKGGSHGWKRVKRKLKSVLKKGKR